MLRVLLLILLVAGHAQAKDPFYGEYIEHEQPGPATCLSRLAHLGKNIRAKPMRAVAVVLAVAAVSVTVVGFSAAKSLREARKSQRTFEQVVTAPWKEKILSEYAQNVAWHELDALDKTRRRSPHYETLNLERNLILEMKKFADIWHEHKGDEIAKNERSLKAFLEIRTATIARMVIENNGTSLRDQMGYGNHTGHTLDWKRKQLSLLRRDTQRLLALPATRSDRPAEYRKLVAEVLANLETGAVEHTSEEWNTTYPNWSTKRQFSETAAKKQQSLVQDFTRKNFDNKYGTNPESRDLDLVVAALNGVLAKAKPGQTVADCLKENGIDLFSLKTQELFDLLYSEEVLSP